VITNADDLRNELFATLQRVMPNSAFDLVKSTIQEVTENSSGGKLTFGILAALYSASAGIDSIRIALNGVYNLTETRPWWKTKLLSLTMTLGLGILLTIALGVVFYEGQFISMVLGSVSLPIQSPILLGILQILTVAVVLVTIFALLYNYLPKHKNNKWAWVTPGAITGIILWLLLSYGFKLYLGYFDSYDKTYGSLGAVIILMLWLYLTALVILIGGTMNAVLQEFTDPETAMAATNKAAAKEVVENPDSPKKSVSQSKIGIPEQLIKKDENSLQKENDKSGFQDDEQIADEKPINKKSVFKLVTGIIIGFVSSIRKR
jgi:membrane protein